MTLSPNQTHMFNAEAGQSQKDDALALLEQHGGSALHALRDYAVKYARAHGRVTIDHVTMWAENNSIELPSKTWGAVFRKCSLKGFRWMRIGYVPSIRVSNHARPVSEWMLVPA